MLRILLFLTVTVFPLLAADSLEDRINALEERLRYYEETERIIENVERKSLQDRINFSADLRLRMDDFSYKLSRLTTDVENSGGTEVDRDAVESDPFDKNFAPHVALNLRINMTAQMDENMRFFGRLIASRSSQNNERLCVLSRNITAESETVSTVIDFDRAYVDWLVGERGGKWYLSAGILPTSGGSSSNMIEDSPRKSMFPSLIFDANVMGGIVTADISNQTGLDKSFIRFIHGKAFTLDAKQFYYQCNRETIRNMDVTGLFAETQLPGFADSLLYLGINEAANIKAVPYLGSSSASIELKTLDSLGDITNISAGIELRRLGGSLDWFLHAALSDPDGNSHTMDFTDTSPTLDATTAYTNASYARGGLLSDGGRAFYSGVRYHVSPALKLGAEYNEGSKYWWSATQGSEDVFNKLATRGHAGEFYLNYQFNRVIDTRIGYLHIHENYTGSGWHFGEPASKDGDQYNYYLIVRARL